MNSDEKKMLLPKVSITLDTNQQPAAVIRDALSSARLVPRLSLHLGLREADAKDCRIFQRSSLLCPSFSISSTPQLLLRWRSPKLPLRTERFTHSPGQKSYLLWQRINSQLPCARLVGFPLSLNLITALITDLRSPACLTPSLEA